MRKGARRIDWTTKELNYLRDNACILSARQICKHLKRSKSSVECQARRMGLSLRCYKQKLQWCPMCANWRATVSPKTGICRVCSKRQMLEAGEDRVSEALEQLSIDQRAEYNDQEVHRISKMPPKPTKKKVDTKSRYLSAKEEERYAREIEAWQIKCIDLRIDANKTRLRRIREKSGTNPRKSKMNDDL